MPREWDAFVRDDDEYESAYGGGSDVWDNVGDEVCEDVARWEEYDRDGWIVQV